jgi:hypothetical protein
LTKKSKTSNTFVGVEAISSSISTLTAQIAILEVKLHGVTIVEGKPRDLAKSQPLDEDQKMGNTFSPF